MVGRRVNSFRCWSIGKSDFFLSERVWRFAGLQIPSMAYPPSSTVSYFNQIYFISNLNDWLIVDGVFFVILCIILLSNKTEKSGIPKWYTYCFFRSVVQSKEAFIDLQRVDTSEMTTPKMHRDKKYTGLDLDWSRSYPIVVVSTGKSKKTPGLVVMRYFGDG